MSLIGDIAGAYRAPSNSMQVQMERGITEPQTLFYGMLFGVINLIASFPRVILSAPDQDTFTGIMAGLFIWLSLQIVCMDLRSRWRGKRGVKHFPVEDAETIAGSCRDTWLRRLGSGAGNPSTGCAGC